MLLKKIEALTKAMEVESKKMKREAAARDKEMMLAKSEDNKQKNRNTNVSRRSVDVSTLLNASNLVRFIAFVLVINISKRYEVMPINLFLHYISFLKENGQNKVCEICNLGFSFYRD